MLNKPFRLMLMATVISSAIGCSKIDWEYIKNNPDKTPNLCNIKTITVLNPDGTKYYDLNFTYNKWGNPTSIIRSPQIERYWGEWLFTYDQQQRISEYVIAFPKWSDQTEYKLYLTWKKFVWENGRVVRDTTRSWGEIVNGKPVVDPETEQFYKYVGYYDYDNKNRIVSFRNLFTFLENKVPNPNVVTTYTYDAAGNLRQTVITDNYTTIQPPVRTSNYDNYSDKANIYRSNKIWMFLANNYSVNSHPMPLEIFKGILPAKYRLPQVPFGGTGFKFFTSYDDIGNANIEYVCK